MIKHAVIAISLLSVYLPCSKKDDGADGGDAMAMASDAAPADAAPAALPEPVAKNAGKIGRFPTDTTLNMDKDKILAEAAIARESPGGGPWVATLKKDTEVTKIVAHGDYILVAFADPKASADILEGWISKNGFVAGPAVVVPAGGKCSIKGQVFFTGAACKYECSSAIPCPAGLSCTGMGSRPDKTEGSAYCEGAVVDAGAPAPISCTGGLMLGTDNKCHTKCTTNKDCNGGKGVCTAFGSLKGCVP